MASQEDNILQFSQYMKSSKMLQIIYANPEFLIEKVDLCANNPEKSLTTKVEQHIPYRCSMSTMWAFDNIENKVILYREEDCVKKVCTSLSEHASNVINKKEPKIHEDAKACYCCGKRFSKRFADNKNYQKVRDHCHFIGKYGGATHSICNFRFKVPNKVPVVARNESNYDYNFIIKKLANKF